MQLIIKTKGVSLPLVIGLVTVLMISAASINALIIRALQSAQRIEASSRAYFAAEAGIEDALYELAPHLAGYETTGRFSSFNNLPDLCPTNSAKKWCNDWEIESLSGASTWNGKFFANEKLMIYLFKDVDNTSSPGENVINDPENSEINTINPGFFSITFSIPNPTFPTTSDTQAYLLDDSVLQIDNDRDFDSSALSGLNEDSAVANPPGCNCICEANTDCDGDGQINEDGEEDPVILWKLTDGDGRSLIPLSGCISDSTGTDKKSEICEKDFNNSTAYSVVIDQDTYGEDIDGNPEKITDFIFDTINANSPNELQFEFLIIAPLEHTHMTSTDSKQIVIPYIEYEVDTPEIFIGTSDLPLPFFTIKSDGYYGNYKQSINTRVLPKTTVPLFDFTIIQQE